MESRTSSWTAWKIAIVFALRGEIAAIKYSNKLAAKGK